MTPKLLLAPELNPCDLVHTHLAVEYDSVTVPLLTVIHYSQQLDDMNLMLASELESCDLVHTP